MPGTNRTKEDVLFPKDPIGLNKPKQVRTDNQQERNKEQEMTNRKGERMRQQLEGKKRQSGDG